MIEVRVLDVVALFRDGVRVPVSAGKVTELLVRLALEPGVMVRTDRLIEDLWAVEAHATARNTLQAKVSRLRRALGAADLVTGSQAGYTLNVERSAVDAFQVLEHSERTSTLRRAGDPSGALESCETALEFFSGEASGPVATEPGPHSRLLVSDASRSGSPSRSAKAAAARSPYPTMTTNRTVRELTTR